MRLRGQVVLRENRKQEHMSLYPPPLVNNYARGQVVLREYRKQEHMSLYPPPLVTKYSIRLMVFPIVNMRNMKIIMSTYYIVIIYTWQLCYI